MKNLVQPSKVFVGLLVIMVSLGVVKPVPTQAASPITSIDAIITSGGGDCSPSSPIFVMDQLIVEGVAENPLGLFSVIFHYGGINGDFRSIPSIFSDGSLGQVLFNQPITFFNGVDEPPFTQLGDTPYMYLEVASNDISYFSNTWYYDCVTGTVIYPFSPTMITYPHNGMIQISTAQLQPLYDAPAGSVVHDGSGNAIWLPNDADNNGFDTYVITEIVELDGRFWLGIWMGSANAWGWVPFDKITPLSVLP